MCDYTLHVQPMLKPTRQVVYTREVPPPLCNPCLPRCRKPPPYCRPRYEECRYCCPEEHHHQKPNYDHHHYRCHSPPPSPPPPRRCCHPPLPKDCCEAHCKPIRTKYVVPCYRYEDGRIFNQPTEVTYRALQVALDPQRKKKIYDPPPYLEVIEADCIGGSRQRVHFCDDEDQAKKRFIRIPVDRRFCHHRPAKVPFQSPEDYVSPRLPISDVEDKSLERDDCTYNSIIVNGVQSQRNGHFGSDRVLLGVTTIGNLPIYADTKRKAARDPDEIVNKENKLFNS